MATPTPMPPRVRRVDTMLQLLNQVSDDYTAAKNEYDAARIAYEVAREKFSSVRRLALNVLSKEDWWQWRMAHPSVQYTGLKIGEAIALVLDLRAIKSAMTINDNFDPWMSLNELQDEMERGGFEFRSTAPLREVNAALLHLEHAVKDKTTGLYKSKEADNMLELFRPPQDEPEKEGVPF